MAACQYFQLRVVQFRFDMYWSMESMIPCVLRYSRLASFISTFQALRVMYGAASLRWTVALAAAGAGSTGGAAGARMAAPAPPPPPCAEPMLSALPALRWSIYSSSAAIGLPAMRLGAPEAPKAGAAALPLRFRPSMDL